MHMCRVTHIKKSHHTCEWVLSHIHNHVTRMNGSYISHVWIRCATHANVSCHTHTETVSQTWMSLFTSENKSCHPHKLVMHFTLANGSHHPWECIVPQIQRILVKHVKNSCWRCKLNTKCTTHDTHTNASRQDTDMNALSHPRECVVACISKSDTHPKTSRDTYAPQEVTWYICTSARQEVTWHKAPQEVMWHICTSRGDVTHMHLTKWRDTYAPEEVAWHICTLRGDMTNMHLKRWCA